MDKSTRGASKHRRDLINTEIERLKDLLPLSETIRQRLFQLQVMSLVCIFVRKERYLPHILGPLHCNTFNLSSCGEFDYDVCKALRGFLLMVTRQGKLLYLSENAADYLAHSVEEIMSQGDSLYDLVDQRDHATVQSELLSGPPSFALFPNHRVFMCRMNVCRTARRHPQYHKFVIIHGHYLHYHEYYNLMITQNTVVHPVIHPVFAAYCTPLVTPENAEILAPGNTTVCCSWHSLDLKFVEVDELTLFHFAYKLEDLLDKSFYALVHPSDVLHVSRKHKLLCEDKENGCMLLLRLKTGLDEFAWLHVALKLKDIARDENSIQIISITYQMLSDIERATLQANKWIYATPQRFHSVEQAASLSSIYNVKSTETASGQGFIIDPNSNFCCVSVSTPLFDPTVHLATLAAHGLESKPKRKYASYKTKKASQQHADNGQQSRGNVLNLKHKSLTTRKPQQSKTKAIPALRTFPAAGLSPPTSADSTEEDHAVKKSITVQIPSCQLPAPEIINSVLTPDVSPLNNNLTASISNRNKQQHHVQSPGSKTLMRKMNLVDPMLSSAAQGSLPILDQPSLEAFFQTVEAENCLPVFGSAAAFEDDILSLCSLPSDEPNDFLPHVHGTDVAAKSPHDYDPISELKSMPKDSVENRKSDLSVKIEPIDQPSLYHTHRSYSWCQSGGFKSQPQISLRLDKSDAVLKNLLGVESTGLNNLHSADFSTIDYCIKNDWHSANDINRHSNLFIKNHRGKTTYQSMPYLNNAGHTSKKSKISFTLMEASGDKG